MTETPEPAGDPIDQLLRDRLPRAEQGGTRQTIFLQTTGVLRRRRQVKRLSLIPVLAACYAAGLVTMRLCMTPAAAPVSALMAQNVPKSAADSQGQTPVETADAPLLENDPEAPALIIERIASASEGRRARLYRVAGDRYLETDGDMQGALRCYTLALESDKEEDLSITADDNWLLMALKKARLEEKNHAKNDG